MPCHGTVCVRGRRVVSARHGAPSSLPRRTAERSSLIGKSGFVIVVEREEKEGTTRSTRREAGASLRRVRAFSLASGGRGIVARPEAPSSRAIATTSPATATPATAASATSLLTLG